MPAISLLGSDYASIPAWWAAEKDNDYSGVGPILEIPAGVIDTFAANFQFRYGTASKYTIRAQAGSEFVGIAANESEIAVINFAGFQADFRNQNINFENVFIKDVETTSSGDSFTGLKFKNCLVLGGGTLLSSSSFTADNSIIITNDAYDGTAGASGVFYLRNSTQFIGQNCTLVDASSTHIYGALRNRSTAAHSLANSVIIGVNCNAYSEQDAPPLPTITNCCASDATLPSAILTNLTTSIFVDFAGGDYRIKSDSAPAQLSTPAGAFIYVDIPQDPQLDTPQADITIQEGQTGTIDLGANFSDANPGDTLTYSISPAMSAGFSFNTATGVITYNGSQAVAAAKTYTVICSDGNGGSPATDSFSITVVTASFIVDSISTNTPDAGSTISINYSNAAAAVTASCSAGTLNKVSDNGTTAVFDVPVPPLFGDKTLNYNTAFNITFSDGTTSQAISFNVQLPAGEQFAQIATIDADGIYANDAGAAPGQYAHAKNISGDMVIDLTTGLVTYNPTVNNSFDYAIYDGVWGTYAAVAYTAETVKPVITLNGAASLVWVQNVAWVDPGATVTDNVDATRQITSSSAPNVSVVGSYSLAYNATDAAGNAADTVTRTVIVSSADTTPNQFTFVDVNNAELNTLYQNTQSITGVDAGQTLTATNGQLSNDNGVTWSSSCQMVTGQTLVRASITTTGTNSLEHTQLVTVNGISDTFSVTTKAAVTRTFSIGSSDPVVDTQGANLTHTYGIWQLFDKIPEDTTAVLIDSGINFTVTNGVGSVQTSAAQPSTNYIFVARDSGTSPANYIRTVGQVA